LIIFSFAYPSVKLPRAETVAQRHARVPDESAALTFAARKCRRSAHIILARRYCGTLLGLFVVVLCLWTITYRIATSLYAWQFELLTTGLAREEVETVRQVLASLR
jgi:hypothetical protein